jgi:hypothetical protein
VRKAFRRLAFLPTAVALAATFFSGSMLMQVPAARAAAAADADSREVTRLINVARAAAGKHALNVDVFLASKARDGSIPCPDDPDKTISGRARDFSTYGQMDHKLRLCDADGYALSTTSFVSTLQNAWGYGAVGEILLVNGGYGQGQFLYTYKGVSTWTYTTTGHAMLGWATSPSHWNIVMGSYDRVGCGAWTPGGTTIWYACLFAGGGPAPSGVTAPPTKSPFSDPLPTSEATPVPTQAPVATPKPATPKPVATPKPATPKPAASSQAGAGTSAGASTDDPNAGPSASPEAAAGSPVPSTAPVMDVEAATLLPSDGATPEAIVALAQPSSPPTTEPAGVAGTNSGAPSSPSRNQAVMIVSAAGAWLGLFILLLIQRRRRLRHLPAHAA